MARLKQRYIEIPESASPDVTKYRLYYTPDTAELMSYNLNYIESSTPAFEVQAIGLEGEVKVAATALDDWGNESDMGESVILPLDLTAPDAPGTPYLV